MQHGCMGSAIRPTRRQLLSGALGLGFASRVGGREWMEPGVDCEVPEPSARVECFDRLAFGMFVHWGLYSQLAAGAWAKRSQGIATGEYMNLMERFRASEFSGRELARAAKRAGMGYVTLTSRHHDGFSLYDTHGLSPYDVTHTPAGRDLVADFVEGCNEEGVLPMLYCSTLDWSEPLFEGDWKGYLAYLRASVELLCKNYGPVGGFWFDGNWSKRDADWETDALYGMIRELQPDAMVIEHAAREMCDTLNFHCGAVERDIHYLSPAHVIEELWTCRGAELVLNATAYPHGTNTVVRVARVARG